MYKKSCLSADKQSMKIVDCNVEELGKSQVEYEATFKTLQCSSTNEHEYNQSKSLKMGLYLKEGTFGQQNEDEEKEKVIYLQNDLQNYTEAEKYDLSPKCQISDTSIADTDKGGAAIFTFPSNPSVGSISISSPEIKFKKEKIGFIDQYRKSLLFTVKDPNNKDEMVCILNYIIKYIIYSTILFFG
jgi:hypothetical protein